MLRQAELGVAAAMAGRLCSVRTTGGRGEAGREDKDQDGTNAVEGQGRGMNHARRPARGVDEPVRGRGMGAACRGSLVDAGQGGTWHEDGRWRG